MGVFTVGRQVALEIDMPGWWLANASIDMDFRRGLYYDSSTANPRAATDFLACTRASTGYAQNTAGTWVSFAANTLRITDVGLLIEDSRTNNLLNSAAPVTQTTASLATGSYTLWVEGSGSALASGGSATITGAVSATQGSPDTFTVTVAGTVTVTVTGSLTRFQLEEGTFVTSFILTTGAAASRAADDVPTLSTLLTVLTSNAASVVVDFKKTGFNVGGDTDNQKIICQATSNTNILTMADTTGISGNTLRSLCSCDGTNLAQTSGSDTGNLYNGAKAGSSWGGAGISTVIVGGTVNTAAFDGSNDATDPRIGKGNNTAISFGYVRRLTAWNSKLADGTLQGFTV